MKRVIALLLAALVLTGCAFSGIKKSDSVVFCYLRVPSEDNSYDAFFSEGIIGSEERDATGHLDDLDYLLTIYFRGPLDAALTSPFPMGSRVLETRQENGQLTLILNPILAENSDLDITIACACLAKTCMNLTDADTVQIESRNPDGKLLFSRTFTHDNLFLRDDYTPPVETTENTQ